MAYADSIRTDNYTREELADLIDGLVGAWTTWTPTYGMEGTGTFTSITTDAARYLELETLVFYNLVFYGTIGGAGRYLTVSLPVNAGGADSAMQTASIDSGSGDIVGRALIRTSPDNIRVYNMTDTDLATGGTFFYISGFYEKA